MKNMAPSPSDAASRLARISLAKETIDQSGELLEALFGSSTVGVAIVDRELRFQAINDALASMNGVPAEAHIGRTLHAVLGKAASKIQPAFDHVFATGQPLSNIEVSAELPYRTALGHWSESYFPIKDRNGQVHQVGAIVLELTKRKELDATVLRLSGKLKRAIAALRSGSVDNPAIPRPARLLARCVGHLQGCLTDAREISQVLHDAPPMPVQGRLPRSLSAEQSVGIEGAGVVADHSLAGDLKYPCPLSAREREVIALIALGRSNKEIASLLMISTRTVESHRAKIMLKLGLHSLSGLVLYAVRNQLIQA
jgi:DNA-binding CsgD family transcriptional regulator